MPNQKQTRPSDQGAEARECLEPLSKQEKGHKTHGQTPKKKNGPRLRGPLSA
jgi:hypothetical protein